MMDGNLPTDLQKPLLRNAAAPKDAIDLADEALGLPPRARNLPPPPENDATMFDVMGAAWDAETVKTDAWGHEAKLRRDLTLDMWNALPQASKDEIDAERFDKHNNWEKFEYIVARKVREVAQTVPEAAMLFGKFPQSQEAFDARINDQRRAELEEANAITNQPGGGVAEFLGGGARAMTDSTSLALIPFGGPAGGSILKFAAIEAGLGALGEAAVLPREFQVAQELGLPDPDVGTRLAFGALAGGVLGAGIHAVPRVLSYATARRVPIEQAAREGEDILDAEAAVDAAEAQMRGDTTIVEEIGMPKLPPKSPLAQALGQDNAAFGGVDFNFRAGGNAAAQTNRVGYVFGKLVELGYPPHVAAGLVGNLMQESGPGLNTRAVGDGGNAFGMGQWNGPRMRALNAFARKNGGDPASLDIQVQFLHHELQNSERGALDQIMRAPDAESAAAIASDVFWRPGIPHKANRVAYARSLAEQFDGGVVPKWQGANILPDGGGMPDFGPTSRGYTGTGQVSTASGTRIDVAYEVVDLSSLTRASGDLQPRDRSRITSDAQIADIAARLDPAQLMPMPTADRGTPIVGPDNVIESGNGRFGAIERAYELHPDRAATYRAAIEDAGFSVPAGVERPVLIARRTSEMTQDQRVQFAIDAQDAGVAVMNATEIASNFARALTPDVLLRYNANLPLTDAANGDFLRAALSKLPMSARNAMFDASGILSHQGERQLREAMFARAWSDPDIIAMFAEADAGDLRSLMDALESAAPNFAALKADIDKGLVLPEMDISGHVLDAMRLIATARRLSRQEGNLPMATAISELLDEVDLLTGAVAPLTTALVRKFWSNGKAASADKVAGFLSRYADDARIAGATNSMFDAPSPADVLRAIDPDTFRDLPDDLGPVRGFARVGDASPAPTMLDDGFNEGAASAEATEVDAQIRGEIEAEVPNPFGPVFDGFENNPAGAIEHLMGAGHGEVKNAVVRQDIGPIAFVYGKAGNPNKEFAGGFGIAHIAAKHPEMVEKLPSLLTDGRVMADPNGLARKYILADGNTTAVAVVRMDWDGQDKQWLVTAFEDDFGKFTRDQKEAYRNDLTDARVPASSEQGQDTVEQAINQARNELASAWVDMAENAGLGDSVTFADLPFKMEDGTTANARDFLKDLGRDETADNVLQLCRAGGTL